MEDKKIIKKQVPKDSSEKDSYVGVMMEKVNDKLDLILEDREVLHSRIDRLDGRMGNVEVRLESLEVKVDDLDEKFNNLDEKFDGLEVKFDGLEVKVDLLDGKVDGLDEKFDDLAQDVQQKADKKDVVVLGHRITKLEAN